MYISGICVAPRRCSTTATYSSVRLVIEEAAGESGSSRRQVLASRSRRRCRRCSLSATSRLREQRYAKQPPSAQRVMAADRCLLRYGSSRMHWGIDLVPKPRIQQSGAHNAKDPLPRQPPQANYLIQQNVKIEVVLFENSYISTI